MSSRRRPARRHPHARLFASSAVLCCLGAVLLYGVVRAAAPQAPTATATATARTMTRHGTLASARSDMRAVASLGFDFVTVSAWPEELDRAQAAGLKVLVWLGGFDYTTCTWNWDTAKLRDRLRDIRGHPAIYGYFVDDEPHAFCPTIVKDLRHRNALIKSIDPGALTFIAENRVEALAPLANVVDVLGVVAYPCSHEHGCVYSKITDKVAVVEKAGWRHYYGMVQTAGDDYYRSPTPAELRRILDTWHATREEGEVNFAWDCCGRPETLADHPELWDTWRAENALR